ncbi:hypothetical protein VTJ83DRAFT_674 [Remersonia thermophila]|uniref:Uncharacterized protein n=1 Tax=Remersonia thermophila TaxID=72144 RepID=A0ABR4DLL9_9PEZI
MSSRRNSLTPPERRDTADPGAHDLAESSDSEEHYSDAKSGPTSSGRASPIPKTRVERVDDKPAYGEVPGTEAYRLREGDAVPDEIAIIPDPSDPTPPEPEPEPVPRSPTPGGHPIPKTVVEETPDTEGSVTHHPKRERRLSDAHPDVIVKPDGKRIEEGEAASDIPIEPPSLNIPEPPTQTRRKSSSSTRRPSLSPSSPGPDNAVGDDDDFGDEFDDFEEGGGDADDADFGDFDDGFQEATPQPQPQEQPPPTPPPPQPSPLAAQPLPFSIPNFENLSTAEILSVTEPYLSALFPPETDPSSPSALSAASIMGKDAHPIFLTPRSASLWSQLVAPPPLQPPDWIRSRIRRLFLVSLGVPVDLDEILPAESKQKKLVLPSAASARLRRPSPSSSSRRASSDSRADKGRGSTSAEAEGSTAAGAGGKDAKADGEAKGPRKQPSGSGGSGEQPGSSRRQNASPERLFDIVSARRECTRTEEALRGMTDDELRQHVGRLEAMQAEARRVLAYWQQKADEQIAEREAFEGVIENLVKHARKVRK